MSLNALAVDCLENYIDTDDNIIETELFNGTIRRKEPNRIKQRRKSSEVFPFKTMEEIRAMINTIDKHINEATTQYSRKRWCRNKMIFIIGINVGIRGSDLCELRWRDFFYDDYVFRDGISIQPIKTRNTSGKYVHLVFNNNVKMAISEYIEQYPIESLDDYVFFSKTTSKDGTNHIDRQSLGRMVKSVAKECGIRQNVNSHSLRKTFGYHRWHNAKDKSAMLSKLQLIFGHASLVDTQKYIGIQQEELEEVFNDLESLY